jgi:hypothetical protein
MISASDIEIASTLGNLDVDAGHSVSFTALTGEVSFNATSGDIIFTTGGATSQISFYANGGSNPYVFNDDNQDVDLQFKTTGSEYGFYIDAGNDRVGILTNTPAYPLDVNGIIGATNFISSVAVGTSPYACTSTTLNTNLNADLWDGHQFVDYLDQAIKTSSTPTFAGVFYAAEHDNGDSGSADTIDWSVGNKQKSTLTDNCEFTFTAPGGTCNLLLRLIQDGTGGHTVTWPLAVLWADSTAPTLSTDPNAIDIIAFYYDGTNYYGQASLDFGS